MMGTLWIALPLGATVPLFHIHMAQCGMYIKSWFSTCSCIGFPECRSFNMHAFKKFFSHLKPRRPQTPSNKRKEKSNEAAINAHIEGIEKLLDSVEHPEFHAAVEFLLIILKVCSSCMHLRSFEIVMWWMCNRRTRIIRASLKNAVIWSREYAGRL